MSNKIEPMSPEEVDKVLEAAKNALKSHFQKNGMILPKESFVTSMAYLVQTMAYIYQMQIQDAIKYFEEICIGYATEHAIASVEKLMKQTPAVPKIATKQQQTETFIPPPKVIVKKDLN